MTLYRGDKVCLPTGSMTVVSGPSRPRRKVRRRKSVLTRRKPKPRRRNPATKPRKVASRKVPRMPRARITFKFGVQTYRNIAFWDAVRIVGQATLIERKHCREFTKMVVEKHWVISGMAKALSSAKAPTDKMWAKPLATLVVAYEYFASIYDTIQHPGYDWTCKYLVPSSGPDWYTLATCPPGSDMSAERWAEKVRMARARMAVSLLKRGVREYQQVHKAWYRYREQIGQGAERAKLMIEIAVDLALTAAGGGIAGKLAGTGIRLLAKKAATAAAIKTSTDAALNLSKKIQKADNISYTQIVTKSLKSGLVAAAGSAAGDVLTTKLLNAMRPVLKVPGSARLDHTKWQKLRAEFLSGQGSSFLTGTLNKVLDDKKKDPRKRTQDEVVDSIAKEMRTDIVNQAWMKFLAAAGVKL